MLHKSLIAVLLISVAVSASLWLQNTKLHKRISELETEIKEANAAPAAAVTKPVTSGEASPFDKPHTDPMEDKFTKDSKGQVIVTSIQFDRMIHDYGRINEGDKVKTKFKFTNTGQYALVITRAIGSCGCTVADWPKEPVKPGASGVIDVAFDSEGKHGEVSKTVSVNANTTPPVTTLTIKSTVIPRDK